MRVLLARVGAGFCAAALTGAIVGVGLAAFSFVVDPGARSASTLVLIPVAAGYGLIVGGIPAAFVASLSRARHLPWRHVPTLAAGASIGFLCGLLAAEAAKRADWGFAGAFVGAIVGAIVVAAFAKKPAASEP